MLFFYLLAIGIGMIAVFQNGLNSSLARAIESNLWATIISFFIGFVTLIIGVLFAHQTLSMKKVLSLPPYLFFGGVLGAILVLGLIFLFPKIGAANIVIFTLLGQMLCSVVIDHYGWFGTNVSLINWQKIAALFLMLVAILWFQKSRG